MSRFRVLLIDDEQELVTTLVERLHYRDIEAEYALDGVEGLMKMRTGNFQIAVVDLKLPGMGGAEVLKRIRNKYPDVPVLLITGHVSADTESETIPEGAFDYLVKPVNLKDLIAKMEEALGNP